MRENKLLFLLLLFLVFEPFSQITTQTGFYWPTGRPPFLTDKPWLACNGNYFFGYCHLGHDFIEKVGAPVYAIADGRIVLVSHADWGPGNIGLLIEHHLNDGKRFLAIYGHLKHRKYKRGDKFIAGEIIGRIGRYSKGDHLHFGVIPRLNFPKRGWGRMKSPAKWPYNGLTDPISWIEYNFPRNQSDRNSVLLFAGVEEAENGDILFEYHKLTAPDTVPGAGLIVISLDTSYFCLKNFCMGITTPKDLPDFVNGGQEGLSIAGERSDFIWQVDMDLSDWNFGHGELY